MHPPWCNQKQLKGAGQEAWCAVQGLTQLILGFLAQFLELQLAHLVGSGLTRPGDVAVDLHLDACTRVWRVPEEVLDGLLPAPAEETMQQ